MVSERIKKLRELHGLSQTQLAKKINITRSSVNAWELGISVPSTQYIVELAMLFKVTTDYLLGVEAQAQLKLDGLTDEEIGLLYGMVSYFNKDKNGN